MVVVTRAWSVAYESGRHAPGSPLRDDLKPFIKCIHGSERSSHATANSRIKREGCSMNLANIVSHRREETLIK